MRETASIDRGVCARSITIVPYRAVIPMFKGLDCDCINIPTDGEGIQSNILRQTLESWPATKPKPKILYTIPVQPHSFILPTHVTDFHFWQYGCNPTGMTTSLERRREVLLLAEEHDFLILEGEWRIMHQMSHITHLSLQTIHTTIFTTEQILEHCLISASSKICSPL
jgi:tryptophan aminotransferase